MLVFLARRGPFREVRRTALALGAAARPSLEPPPWTEIGRVRAVLQIGLTGILFPVCVWVLFGSSEHVPASREAASALLGAIVAFWLKD